MHDETMCPECNKRPCAPCRAWCLTCTFRAMRLLILLRTFTQPKRGTL